MKVKDKIAALDRKKLYQKAMVNFEHCIKSNKEFVQKRLNIPLEIIRVEESTISLRFDEYNMKNHLIDIVVLLYNNADEQESIGDYLYTEDEQGNWIRHHLNFYEEGGSFMFSFREITYPFQEKWVLDKKQIWSSNDQCYVEYADGKIEETTQHLFRYEGEAVDYIVNLERKAQDRIISNRGV